MRKILIFITGFTAVMLFTRAIKLIQYNVLGTILGFFLGMIFAGLCVICIVGNVETKEKDTDV